MTFLGQLFMLTALLGASVMGLNIAIAVVHRLAIKFPFVVKVMLQGRLFAVIWFSIVLLLMVTIARSPDRMLAA